MEAFVHKSSVIADNVELGKKVYVGPNCILGFSGYQIKKNNKNVKPLMIGDKSIIHGNTVIANNVLIGKNVYVGPNCTLGFSGYQIKKNNKNVKPLMIGDKSIIYGNTVICKGTQIGKECRLDYLSFIGEETTIGKNCVVEYGARIYDRVIIQDRCFISGFVSNDCLIEKNTIVQGDLIHKFKDIVPFKPELSPIVKANSFIGRKALVIGPIVIEKGSYIGSGAIVTKSTKINKLYLGVPAREVGLAPRIHIKNHKKLPKS